MRCTAILLVCLNILLCLSGIDAYSARFTSENGMLVGKQQVHARKLDHVEQGKAEPLLQRLEDGEPFGLDPANFNSKLSQTGKYISKALQGALNSKIGSLSHLLHQFMMEPKENNAEDTPAEVDIRRNTVRNDSSKKRFTEWAMDDSKSADVDNKIVVNYLTLLKKVGSKAIDIASVIVSGIDGSNQGQRGRDLKEQTLEILRIADVALSDIIDDIMQNIVPVHNQTTRRRGILPVRKMTNTRNALRAQLKSLSGQKRSLVGKIIKNPKIRKFLIKKVLKLIKRKILKMISNCIQSVISRDEPAIRKHCVVLPWLKRLASLVKKIKGNRSTAISDFATKFKSNDSVMKKLHLGDIFVIPIINKHHQNKNTTTTTTTPPFTTKTVGDDSEGDNETTTTTVTEPTTTTSVTTVSTTEPTTTSISTTTTTEAAVTDLWPDDGPDYSFGESGELPIPEEPEPDDRKYRSKYDVDY